MRISDRMPGRARNDEYPDFAALNACERESADFRVRVVLRANARTVILAPHGGGIEPGTSEVACGIAGEDLSLALFEGTLPAHNHRLHITSTRFDEPRCLELVEGADRVVAIHGERSASPVAYLGGRDSDLGESIRMALERGGYSVRAHEEEALQGWSPANICNRGRGGAGVQLELSAGLRRTFFPALTAAGRARPTAELARFVGAVREGLREAGAGRPLRSRLG